MARLDVYARPSRDRRGYVLDVQVGPLAGLATRTFVLLLPEQDLPKPIRDLNPIFAVRGERHVMVTQTIATIPTRDLGQAVASLDTDHDKVTRALDVLLLGY
jgi:toxin CcdB